MPSVNLAEREQADARLASWITGCARGDEAALQSLYSALSPQLFGLLLRILQRRDLAEEALQETFVSVWQKASEYRADRGRVSTWIFAIGRYRALDMLRRERREVSLDPEQLLAACDANALAMQEGEDSTLPRSAAEYRRLRQCLEALSKGQRSSLLLAYFHGCTQEEVATRLDTPLGTVKSWVRRALVSLKSCLER